MTNNFHENKKKQTMNDYEEKTEELSKMMSTRSLLVIVGLIIVGALFLFVGSASANDAQRDMMDPVWKINGNCSAVVIRSGTTKKTPTHQTWLLTAKHCVTVGKEGVVNADTWKGQKMVQRRSFLFDVKNTNSQSDLALIMLRDTSTHFAKAKLAEKENFGVGDDLYAVGFPLSFVKNLTVGILSQKMDLSRFSKRPSKDDVYLTSVPIAPGNSGGGLFQKMPSGHFELVGIASRGSRQFPHLTLFATLAGIKKFLEFKDI